MKGWGQIRVGQLSSTVISAKEESNVLHSSTLAPATERRLREIGRSAPPAAART